MESFYIDLNDSSSRKPRIRRLLLFGAFVCAGLMLSSLSIFLTIQNSFEWYLLFVGVYLSLYIYYAWVTINTVLFVKADSVCFEFRFGQLKRSKNTMMWDAVSKVRLGPAYIAFFKKSGRRKLVQINWLPYSKVVEIKNALVQMCEMKKIPYERAEIIDYSTRKIKKEE